MTHALYLSGYTANAITDSVVALVAAQQTGRRDLERTVNSAGAAGMQPLVSNRNGHESACALPIPARRADVGYLAEQRRSNARQNALADGFLDVARKTRVRKGGRQCAPDSWRDKGDYHAAPAIGQKWSR